MDIKLDENGQSQVIFPNSKIGKIEEILFKNRLPTILECIKEAQFLKINDNEAILDLVGNVIWNVDPKQFEDDFYVSSYKIFKRTFAEQWLLPTWQQVEHLRRNSKLRKKIFGRDGGSFLVTGLNAGKDLGIIDFNIDSYYTYTHSRGHSISVNASLLQKGLRNFLLHALLLKLKISTFDEPDKNLLNDLIPDVKAYFEGLDYIRTRLPELTESNMTDRQNGGLWELWGCSDEVLNKAGVRARNPEADIKRQMIAIDFGTSSTVVAYEDDKGKAGLLRVGVSDFYQAARPQDYENPTVLEFIDYPAFLEAWKETAYQPLVTWDTVRCSHEARANLRNNDSQSHIVASILPKLKQWALRDSQDGVWFGDQTHQKEDYSLPPLQELNPVIGQKMEIGDDYRFDPIELYAWFLGLNINWRQRGIYLRYGMTFPVGYDRAVKDKILASFRRGLLRSLPETLMNSPRISEFSVRETASEPAAFAAAAMSAENIEPTENGTAYAVFDFGGGTADFDFGLYRLPNEEEADEYEEVFEHFGASGDKFLGGENLLENLAYLVFKANLDTLRQHKIVFTRPLDAEQIIDAEILINRNQAAYTNTQMLVSKLRPYWEECVEIEQGTLSLALLDATGEKQLVDLILPYEEMETFLNSRIRGGLNNFLTAMKTAFGTEIPEEVHILLAGNSCRTDWFLQFFGEEERNDEGQTNAESFEYFNGLASRIFAQRPTFIIHDGLLEQEDNGFDPFAPNAKTGVALGALRLRSGNGIKVINRNLEASSGNAPFKFYVGRLVRGIFQPVLLRGGKYEQWEKLGVVSEGIFNLVYSSDEQAKNGTLKRGDAALQLLAEEFSLSDEKQYIFARIISPNEIELCTSVTDDANYVALHHTENYRKLVLK